jgi:hypothetical protein|tara:strand:+ start:619 stop:1140 length:522 start_codon:yes stop_codon:yes gene_type:complete
MSANRFDTTEADAIADAAITSSGASTRASSQSSVLIAESLEIFSKSMTQSQNLQNEAFVNVLTGLVNQLNINQSAITDKLSTTDVSMNIRTSDTMNKLDNIIQTLTSNNVTSEGNWSQIINNLNDKSNETQQTMIEYISKYIVIPLYEERLNDSSTIYHNFLENQTLENDTLD